MFVPASKPSIWLIPQLGILYLWVEPTFTPYMLNPHGGTPYLPLLICLWGTIFALHRSGFCGNFSWHSQFPHFDGAVVVMGVVSVYNLCIMWAWDHPFRFIGAPEYFQVLVNCTQFLMDCNYVITYYSQSFSLKYFHQNVGCWPGWPRLWWSSRQQMNSPQHHIIRPRQGNSH